LALVEHRKGCGNRHMLGRQVVDADNSDSQRCRVYCNEEGKLGLRGMRHWLGQVRIDVVRGNNIHLQAHDSSVVAGVVAPVHTGCGHGNSDYDCSCTSLGRNHSKPQISHHRLGTDSVAHRPYLHVS